MKEDRVCTVSLIVLIATIMICTFLAYKVGVNRGYDKAVDDILRIMDEHKQKEELPQEYITKL